MAVHLIVSLVVVFSFVPILAQDNHQQALYNYRNDGKFNAWLNFEIDSITYSRVDTLGVEHDDVVVQEVWTPDSLYRIPLEAIDSIGFRAPAPKMRDNLFYIREYHIGHTLSLDSLTVTFSKTISNDSLPSVGQVVLCVIQKAPFEEGFAGRVQQINRKSNGIEVVCTEVSPFDVFERLVIVEMGVSNLDDGPMKIRGELFDEGIKTIELPEKWKDEWAVEFLDLFSITSKNPVVRAKLYADVSAFYYYQNFDIWIDHPDLTYNVSFDWDKISKLGEEYKELKEVWKLFKEADYDAILKSEQEKDLEEKEWEYKIPIPFELAPVNCVFEFGVMLKPQAADLKADLEWKTSVSHHIGFNLTARNPLAPEVEGLTDGWHIDYSNNFNQRPCDSFKADVKIDGSFAFGIFARLKASLITKYLLHASVGAEAGIKLSYSGDFTLYDTDCDVPNAYGLLKDTNIGAKLYGKAKGEVGALPFNLINLNEEIEYPFWEGKFYLFPHFSEPWLATELGYNREYNEMFTTTVSKQLIPLLSCKPGLAFYSDGLGYSAWKTREAAYFDDLSYDFVTPERDVQISAYEAGLKPGETYRCYPVFKMFGREWKAGPYTEFTYPKPLSLEYPSLILQENVPQLVRIEGGWGDYQVSCYPNDAVKAELFTSGNYSQVRITALKAGTSTVKVLDKRSLETATVEVKVYGNPEDGAAITVSTSTLDMGTHSYGERVSQTFTVTNHGSVELCFNVFNSQVNLDNGIVVSDADKMHYLAPGASHTFTVTANGVGPGHYRMGTIYIASNATKDPESILVKVQGKAPKAEFVDLGLSVKWATFNLGALEASDANAGAYISWGESDSKTSYSWETYKHCDGTAATCHSLGEISGTDNDAARYQWGDGWRLPTVAEMRELKERCMWTWDETGFYKGYWVTGPNGKRIFLEAAGYADGTDVKYRDHGGVYMTGSQGINNTDAAYMLGFEQGQYEIEEAHRYMGVSIRPVYEGSNQQAVIKVEPTEIDFGMVKYGTEKTEKFTVTNTGTGMLTVHIPKIEEGESFFEVSDPDEEFSLVPGQSKDYTVICHGLKKSQWAKMEIKVISNAENGIQIVKVNSLGWDDSPLLEVSNLTMKVGETESVKMQGSYGCIYEISNSNPNVVEAMKGGDNSYGGSIGFDGYYGGSHTYLCITAISTGTAMVKVIDSVTGEEATLTITVTVPAEAVDLGLPSGTKWASCNVGATKPEECGGYYAWGETEVKNYYDNDTYKYYQNDSWVSLGDDISGTEYDVAHVKWRGSWFMPTLDDIKELLDNCTSDWTTLNGVNGYKFTGPNGNSIFLPAAGKLWRGNVNYADSYGFYWSSTQYPWSSNRAHELYFHSGGAEWHSDDRDCGLSVRPVFR